VLTLGRDRLGIKPLYLAEGRGRLRFASSLPALLAGGDVDTALDPVALHHYLSFHAIVPAPRTILAGVRKLPPATVRTVRPDGSTTEHVYWRPEHVRRPEHSGMTARDWSDAVLDALRTAVRRRMVADVPVGVLLSGGLDSSLVVALLAEQGQTGSRRSRWGSTPPAGRRATSSSTPTRWRGPSARTTAGSSSTRPGCCRPSTRRWRRWPSR
jgi:asparagine synthase (glutamine-hydrolysing)